MYLIVHASIGAAVGDHLDPPIISFAGGFASHFLLDIVPHGDERSGRLLMHPERRYLLISLAILDGLAAVSLVIILWLGGFLGNAVGAMTGALGAIVPDFLVGVSELRQGKLWPAFNRLHDRNHQLINIELPLYFGGLIQATFLLIILQLLGLKIL